MIMFDIFQKLTWYVLFVLVWLTRMSGSLHDILVHHEKHSLGKQICFDVLWPSISIVNWFHCAVVVYKFQWMCVLTPQSRGTECTAWRFVRCGRSSDPKFRNQLKAHYFTLAFNVLWLSECFYVLVIWQLDCLAMSWTTVNTGSKDDAADACTVSTGWIMN